MNECQQDLKKRYRLDYTEIMPKRLLIPTLGLFLTSIIFWVSVSGIIAFNYENYVFFPEFSKDEKIPASYSRQTIKTENGADIDLVIATNSQSREYFLYLHGNGSRSQEVIAKLNQKGTVYAPTYPGYSGSESEISLEGLTQTVDATMELMQKNGINQNSVTVIGQSLGGYPALYAGTRYPGLKQIVLINTFYSGFTMCQRQAFIFCTFIYGKLDSAGLAQETRSKTIQFHVKNDEVIPIEEGRRLFEKIGSEDKIFVEMDGSHNDFDFEEIMKRI